MTIKKVKKNAPGMVSAHVSIEEVSCNCKYSSCPEYQNYAQEQVDNIEKFRKYLNEVLKPVYPQVIGTIIMDSFFRCLKYNSAVGGSPTSRHKFGYASDIKVPGLSPENIVYYGRQFWPNSEIVIYDTFVHFAVGGQTALKDYRVNNKGKPIEGLSSNNMSTIDQLLQDKVEMQDKINGQQDTIDQLLKDKEEMQVKITSLEKQVEDLINKNIELEKINNTFKETILKQNEELIKKPNNTFEFNINNWKRAGKSALRYFGMIGGANILNVLILELTKVDSKYQALATGLATILGVLLAQFNKFLKSNA